eukprot:11479430-Prorocentrum_lima.AAC.1
MSSQDLQKENFSGTSGIPLVGIAQEKTWGRVGIAQVEIAQEEVAQGEILGIPEVSQDHPVVPPQEEETE